MGRHGLERREFMLDPAVVDALHIPLPPEPPRIVVERSMLSPSGQAAERIGARMVAQYAANSQTWLKEMNDAMVEYLDVEPGPLTTQAKARFDEAIRDYEYLADVRAALRSKLAKSSARDIKAHFKVDPSLGAATRAVSKQLLDVDDNVIRGILDYTLFLRAVRAERSVEPRTRSQDFGSLRARLAAA